MATVNIEFDDPAGQLKAFAPHRTELRFTVQSKDGGPYWVECMVETPKVLSLAPQSMLERAKLPVGIVQKGESVKKELRVFSSNTTYPSTYDIKFTFLVYDKDATVAERLEYTRELVCSDPNAKVL